MFRYLDAQMLKCLDTWILGCSEAHVDCSKHCALPYNQLLSHSCPLCYNSWRIRHIVKKNMSDIHVVPLQCHIFHCTKVPLRWLGYVYFHLHIWLLCIRSESRCICSARHLWPSPPGREPTMESGGIVPSPTFLLLLNTLQRNLAVQRIFLSQCSCTVAVQRNSPRPERPSLLP